jgi:hypothetical protein
VRVPLAPLSGTDQQAFRAMLDAYGR